MKQEEKELLLKDLCARLLYGVKMTHIADDEHCPKTLIGIAKDMITLEGIGGYECVDIEDYKPYLFPLSSMTAEQKNLFSLIICKLDDSDMWRNGDMIFIDNETDLDYLLNFYNKNHIDFRGLIPMGLALDATGLGIYE